VFAVVVNGAPGAGKTACLMALSDALVKDEIAHAAIDVDEVAWAYPYPSNAERFELLRAGWGAHRRAGHELVLVAEVVESAEELGELLDAVGADDHLQVLLESSPATLRKRIVEREPPGWSGLDYLLREMERWAVLLKELDGVHARLDTDRLSPDEVAARIRAERPDRLGG
jgi:hypothetical protein